MSHDEILLEFKVVFHTFNGNVCKSKLYFVEIDFTNECFKFQSTKMTDLVDS